MSEHTKEPWHIVPHPEFGSANARIDSDSEAAWGNFGQIAYATPANARRIVACVNACAGMDDPSVTISALQTQRDELLAERDKLLFHKAQLVESLKSYMNKYGPGYSCTDTLAYDNATGVLAALYARSAIEDEPTGKQWNAAIDIVRNGRAASEESIESNLNDPFVQAGVACLRQWKREIERAAISASPAEAEPELPKGFNPDNPCDSCDRGNYDKHPECLYCETIEGQVDSEWVPKESETERGGWIKCDYDRPDTLPRFDEVVELAVVNNGQMARAFGGRSGYDEGWEWFQADACLLYGGLPAELGDAMEWDEEKDIWWKPLAPLPQRRIEAAR